MHRECLARKTDYLPSLIHHQTPPGLMLWLTSLHQQGLDIDALVVLTASGSSSPTALATLPVCCIQSRSLENATCSTHQLAISRSSSSRAERDAPHDGDVWSCVAFPGRRVEAVVLGPCTQDFQVPLIRSPHCPLLSRCKASLDTQAVPSPEYQHCVLGDLTA